MNKSVPMGHCFGIIRLCRVMPNSGPWDRFVHPYLTLMIGIRDQVTTNIKHRVRTTGLEHRGQNIRIGYECTVRTDKSVPRITVLALPNSDPRDQNLGFTCIFTSGMLEHIL